MDSFSVIIAAPVVVFVVLGILSLTVAGLWLFCQSCRDYLRGK